MRIEHGNSLTRMWVGWSSTQVVQLSVVNLFVYSVSVLAKTRRRVLGGWFLPKQCCSLSSELERFEHGSI